MTKNTYDFYKGNMFEAIQRLREAKQAGKKLKLKIELFKNSVTLESTQSEQEWLELLDLDSMNDISERDYHQTHRNHKLVMSRAKYLEFQLDKCKHYIYPQRAQQFLEYVDNNPDFAEMYEKYIAKPITLSSKEIHQFPLAIVNCFEKLTRREEGNPDKAFKEILRDIKEYENAVRYQDPHAMESFKQYDRDKIFSALITFYPGGLDLIQKYDPEYLEKNHQKFEAIIAENKHFSQELIEKDVRPTIENSPVAVAKELIKKSMVEKMEEQRKYGFDAHITTDTSILSFEEIYEILKNAQTSSTPLTINSASSTEPESTWYKEILNMSPEQYAQVQARNEKKESSLAEIQTRCVDEMREQIYPQRFQFWQSFVERSTRLYDWGEPVQVDYLIEDLVKYIPLVNQDSILSNKKVKQAIDKLDGPPYYAMIANIMLFAKKGPEFVKKHYGDLLEFSSDEFERICAENELFRAQLQKAQGSYTD